MRRRLATVRARTTIAATVVVGVALAIATVGLVAQQRSTLVSHLDEVADLRAGGIAALARGGTLPGTLELAADDDEFVRVIDSDHQVLAQTPTFDDRFATFRPTGTDAIVRTVAGHRVTALTTATPTGDVAVYVASSLEPVDDAIAALRRALSLGAPALLLLVALTTWIFVGRALRPVERIRTKVAEISDRSLERRVPVPPADDEVGRLATTMNTMLDRLQAASDRQRRFVGDASHELQTPLASMRTDLEVALAHPDGAGWINTARDVLAANERMERLVRDLLYLARADEPRPLPTTAVDLDDVVLDEAARLRQHGRIDIDTKAVSAAAVTGSREDLARVARNLLDNAERYASTRITVELHTNGDGVVLAVSDDGPGIAPGDRERIFERFTRLDDARDRATGGTGLGLAISREIVTAHGGTIAVDDAASGARFVVRLPSG